MIDLDTRIDSLKPIAASRFCCECLSGAIGRIAKYRWTRQEHLNRLEELKQQLQNTFEKSLANRSLWLARTYVAAGAQTVAIWSSYRVISGKIPSQFEQIWAVGGVAWKQAWESEQQWQMERFAELLRKEKK